MARHKRRGSSKSGRPRKEGDRYPSGKLKPAGPNLRVLEKRKQGSGEGGEHPLDFALYRQWITEDFHKAASAYRAWFNRAHIGGPRLGNGSLNEVTPSEELRLNWSQLSDEEIVVIFDLVFSIEAGPADPAALQAAAHTKWKLLNAALKPEEREEMFMVCVLGSWPFWMPKSAADRVLGAKDQRKRDALFAGLGAVSRALRPAKPRAPTIQSAPYRKTRKGRSEEPVRYETEDGVQVDPTSERGHVFEVAILRKRA